jgi:hypothetical protein
MRTRRNTVVIGMVMAVGAVLTVTDIASAGQDQESGRYWSVPRTADGQPDLQGIWANNSATPLQRPEQFGEKSVLTDEELAELTQLIEEFRDNEQAGDLLGDRLIQQALGNATFNDFDAETGNYNAFWLVDRELDNRTSLVIEPSNGRIPPLTSSAQERAEARRAYAREHPSDAAENRGHGDRCVHFEAPRISAGYNSYLQILQTPDYVGVTQEMGHISRMIPVDGRALLASGIRLWTGDSRGYWDGDTLVVETSNYSGVARFQGATDSLRVTERYTRLDADTLEHVVTMNDPNTWTEPWTVRLLLERTEDAIFEYACHEGNYAMPGILGGARAEERAAAENE